MVKRLIFDVDSTLITNVSFNDAVISTLKELNSFSSKNLENFFKGISTYESIYKSYNRSDYKKHLEENMGIILPNSFLDVFFSYLKDVVPPKNDKLIKTIDDLARRYELVLLTNYFKESQLNRLNNMGIGKYFSDAYGESIIKPYPESYIEACGNNNPKDCVMIGDSLSLDIKGALKNGLNALFVNTKNISTAGLNVTSVDKVENISDDIIKTLIKTR